MAPTLIDRGGIHCRTQRPRHVLDALRTEARLYDPRDIIRAAKALIAQNHSSLPSKKPGRSARIVRESWSSTRTTRRSDQIDKEIKE